ncbi:MAG: phosphoribosylanthranilate isomerase [Bacteroidota bacterium]
MKTRPDYVGLIFYGPSKRYVGESLESFDARPSKIVGVFVNASAQTISKKIKTYGLDMVQLHGDESPALCAELRRETQVMKAFGIAEAEDFAACAAYEKACDYFLFDRKTPLYGGSGQQYDWALLEAYRGERPFFLSGGIGPEDAKRIKAIAHEKLWGVDINSAFEDAPGVKNVADVSAFIQELRNEN